MSQCPIENCWIHEQLASERDYLSEARNIMDGKPGVLPEPEHLRAIDEHYQVYLIKIANAIEAVKQNVLKG